MLDKAAMERRIGFHPRCKNIKITHLCFADDLMIFLDGSKRSIEETMKIFDEFGALSGLTISPEKSTIFLAGISEEAKEELLANISFTRVIYR